MDRFRRRMAAKEARQDARLQRVQRRFGNVHRAHNARVAARRAGRFLGPVAPLALIAFLGCFVPLMLSPFEPLDSVRHLAAATPGCRVARAVRLTSASEGQPGYWPQNDQDGDGVACEALPSAQARLGLPFARCRDAMQADAAPVLNGQPGYGEHLDKDRDGIACEPGLFGQHMRSW